MAPNETLESATEAVVAEVTDTKKFDLKAYVKGGAVVTPRGSVDCLTDLDAGYEIAFVLNPQIDELRKEFDGTVAGEPDEEDPRLVALQEQERVLRDRIKATRIHFELRGVAPKLVTVIERDAMRRAKKDGWEEFQLAEYQNTELLMASIVSVTFHAVDETITDRWSHEDAYELWTSLPVDQQNELFNKVTVLTYGVVLSANTVDAGFPRGAVDPAGELRAAAGTPDSGSEQEASV